MREPKWTPDVGTMLDVEDVDAGYGDTTVLRKVGLRVDAGEVVALLGPNGAGKTTLLRVASGLNRANAGKVRVGGDDVTLERPYQRARRGMCHIPEGRGIYPSLTVRENIRLFARGGAEDGALDRATSVFPALGARLSTTSGQLSGGQQQMLSLSRACIQRPSIVLVDEASMGLAPVVVDEIFEYLADAGRHRGSAAHRRAVRRPCAGPGRLACTCSTRARSSPRAARPRSATTPTSSTSVPLSPAERSLRD